MSLADAQAALHNLLDGVNETLLFIAARVDPLKMATHDEAEHVAGQVHDAIAGLRKGIADAQKAAASPGIAPVVNTALAGYPKGAAGAYVPAHAVDPNRYPPESARNPNADIGSITGAAQPPGNYGFGDKLPHADSPGAAVDPAAIKPLGAQARVQPKGKA